MLNNGRMYHYTEKANIPLSQKIQMFSDKYYISTGKRPNRCEISANDALEGFDVPGIDVVPVSYILRNHFYIGMNEE
jgi:hypothetical protein